VDTRREAELLERIRGKLTVSHSPAMPERVAEAHFAAPLCRNCGAALATPYCAACGQKRAVRLRFADLRGEAWEKLRWFEGSLVWSGLRVVLQPGAVARDYVLGARASHVHPLKLLLAAIVVLLLVIHQTGYLGSTSARLSAAIALVQSYSKWSFSLGILAVLLASSLTFWRARGFNLVEHLVLATYTHFVILIASIVNIAPLLVHSTPELVKQHRALSGWYMTGIEAAVVFLAFTQFFAVDWRRHWWRPALGAAAYVLIKKGLLWLYARAVITIVMAQVS
jgi:ribosomal protein L37E